ncbi:sensor histidine kinase [Sphingomicrobium marinum]|uniref:sensor histidine kinase n=1 Tax=Sphingomicrobium marinum TaxID=1227950 RepID=UPI0022402D6A|nr:histidine kinase dimerization/phosphoacceptor domain -containing protein [Sphingomicrobium marinum]
MAAERFDYRFEDEASQRLLIAALNQLAEGVIVADAEGALIFVNDAAAVIHGVRKLSVKPDDYTEQYHLLTLDEKPYPPADLPLAKAVRDGEVVEHAHWKIKRPDGEIVDAIGTARPVLNSDGKQVASVLTLSDRTAELATERKLKLALEARELLLLEVNHRVKNNLALVHGMLSLHARSIKDEGAAQSFRDAGARVMVLADIHRRLYELGTHSEIEVVGMIGDMMIELVKSFTTDREVDLNLKQKGRALLRTDKATPLALAINELTLNSFKHAFDDIKAPRISVDIDAGEEDVVIVYRDNGPGLVDPEKATGSGIGRALISSLSRQLHATVEFASDEPGFYARITVPLR